MSTNGNSKTHERAKQLLLPRERPLFVAELSRATYIFPLVVMGLGAWVQFADMRSFAFTYIPRQQDQKKFLNFMLEMQDSPLGLFIIFLGLVVIMQFVIARGKHVQMVTSMRVVQEIGVWRREFHDIYLSEVKEIKLKRTMFDVLAQRGTITIKSKRKHHEEGKTYDIVLPGVSQPTEFKRVLYDAVGKYSGRAVREKKKKEFG